LPHDGEVRQDSNLTSTSNKNISPHSNDRPAAENKTTHTLAPPGNPPQYTLTSYHDADVMRKRSYDSDSTADAESP